jgi:hypothetical protein
VTVEECKAKIEELRALIVEKMTELEEDPNWGTAEEREELVIAIDELIVQAQALGDALQEGV